MEDSFSGEGVLNPCGFSKIGRGFYPIVDLFVIYLGLIYY